MVRTELHERVNVLYSSGENLHVLNVVLVLTSIVGPICIRTEKVNEQIPIIIGRKISMQNCKSVVVVFVFLLYNLHCNVRRYTAKMK